jgi:hypothetical protein
VLWFLIAFWAATQCKDKESNWLPAPADTFILMMRLYWPKETKPSLLDGSWKIPQVEEVH